MAERESCRALPNACLAVVFSEGGSKAEYDALRCQFGTLKRGEHTKYLPMAFTEQGVAMRSTEGFSRRRTQTVSPSLCDWTKSTLHLSVCVCRRVSAARKNSLYFILWQRALCICPKGTTPIVATCRRHNSLCMSVAEKNKIGFDIKESRPAYGKKRKRTSQSK
jgi:hypothetical protein